MRPRAGRPTASPDSPLGWVVATAGNVAIDRLRRERALRERLPWLTDPTDPDPHFPAEDDAVSDDRLELIFTCCHPALSADASVALTLRLVTGLTTAEIARAFLVPEAAMAQRLVRAKAKIRMAGIPFRQPPGHLLADRLDHTAAVLYLVFNEGYSASSGDDLVRRDLCEESIRLARLVVEQMPAEPEPRGLLALMLLHHARAAARTTASGELVLLEHQDRARWDAAMIRSGSAELRRAERAGAPGPYQLQAAIAELHARAPSFEATDWARVAELYAELAEITPSPVIDLNHAAAVSMAEGPPPASPWWTRSPPRVRSTATTCCTPPAPTCCAGSAAPPTRWPPTRSRSNWPRPRPSATSSSAAAPRCAARSL